MILTNYETQIFMRKMQLQEPNCSIKLSPAFEVIT